jgi:hypothetical protein
MENRFRVHDKRSILLMRLSTLMFFFIPIYFFFLEYFVPRLWADSNLLTMGKQAEKLFSEKLYSDALPLYSQLLDLPKNEELRTQLTLRLATCYLEERQPQAALALLVPLQNRFYNNQNLYLMSLAHRQLGESSIALNLLQQCSLIPHSRHIDNLIALEKGYHFTQLGDYRSAQFVLKKIPWLKSDSLPYYLAQLQLTKIYLMTQQFNSAHQTLFLLSCHLPQSHPLNIERVYLKGWLLLVTHQETQATSCFEELLPKALASKAEWSIQALHGLIISYLRQALTLQLSSDQLQILLSKAERTLHQLLSRAPNDASYLILSDFYLIKAKRLHDQQSYAKAKQLLERQDLFATPDGHKQALLKYAEAAPSYLERNQFYERLCTDRDQPQAFCAKAWFLKGLNHLEEGLRCQKQERLSGTTQILEQAAQAFAQAFQLGKKDNDAQSAHSLKYQALAYAYQPEKIQQAWQMIIQLIEDAPLLSTLEHPQEIYCLAGWIALQISHINILQQAKTLLHHARDATQRSSIWEERCLKLEGLICLQLKKWQEADAIFTRILGDFPHTSSLGEVLFWRAYGADQQQHDSLKKEYLQQVYTLDPQSAYAPFAYFQFYTYREYMRGHRKAIKHLQTMPLLFPTHPLLISAHYLIGLNHKKDQLSEEGQLLRHKDLTSAIEAFQLAESTFDNLFKKDLIQSEQLAFFFQVRYRAQLERAQANLAIAQSSIGGKRQIYLEYAEGVFKELIRDFTSPRSLVAVKLIHSHTPYPKVWADAELKLAQTYEEKKWWKEAEAVLDQSLEHYRQAQVTQSYGLMRVWYEKGKLAQRRGDDTAALQYFIEAEKATLEHVGLSPNEKLDLWIQQSLCYKALNQLDPAMRLLSRVINDDVISPFRVKAMLLRAEIYELQGRPELAIKQLEATARKGGEWALKAQEKLEKVYGY